MRISALFMFGLVLFVGNGNAAWAINYGTPLKPDEFNTCGRVILRDVDGQAIGQGTGTLIAPDILLTAAHVIAPALSPGHIEFRLDNQPQTAARGLAYRTHPEFYEIYSSAPTEPQRRLVDDFSVVGHDVALVKLDQAFPRTLDYYELTTTEPAQGTEFLAIGYGRDQSRQAQNAGIRRRGQLKLQRELDEVLVCVAADGRSQRTDSGDSGGPLLQKTTRGWRLVALINGHNLQEEIDGYAFDEYGYYVSLARQRKWITQTLQELQTVRLQEAAGIYLVRSQPARLQLAVSWKQHQAVLATQPKMTQWLADIIERGCNDPLTTAQATKLVEAGVPEEAFLQMSPNR